MSGDYCAGYMARNNNPRDNNIVGDNNLRMENLYMGMTKQQRAARFKNKSPRKF